MVRTSATKSHGDIAEVKRRVSTALDRYSNMHAYRPCSPKLLWLSSVARDLTSISSHRYGAFAGAVKRADVSAQSSGAKVLEGLAHVATQEQLLLRNSPDLRYTSAMESFELLKGCSPDRLQPCCRRFFAAAINKTDLAALLRSPAVAVQLAALRASNALSQHVETLPNVTVPFVVRHLQSPDGEPLPLCTLCYTCKSVAGQCSSTMQSLSRLCSSKHPHRNGTVLFVCHCKASQCML